MFLDYLFYHLGETISAYFDLQSYPYRTDKTSSRKHLNNIQLYMNNLETKAGFLSGIQSRDDTDDYHTKYVWAHEQALLHAAE